MRNPEIDKILDEIGSKRGSDQLYHLDPEKMGHTEPDEFTPKPAKRPVQASVGPVAPVAQPMQSAPAAPVPPRQFPASKPYARPGLRAKPRIVIRWMVVILLFVSIFYLGRLTMDSVGSDSEDGFFSSISGFFTKSDEVIEDPASIVVAPVIPEITAPLVETAPAPEPTPVVEPAPMLLPEEVPVEEQPLITNYFDVGLEITNVYTEWKETWGKITRLKYKITNGEDGRIQPSYIKMIVKGYEDEGSVKMVPLPKGSLEVPSHKAVSSTAIVPSGFAYSEKQTGNINSVLIIFQLYDANDQLMVAINKQVDLSSTN